MIKLLLFIPLLFIASTCSANWTYLWDFENGTLGEEINQDAIDENGEHDVLHCGGSFDQYNNDYVYAGSKCARIGFIENDTGGRVGYTEPDDIVAVDGVSEYWAGVWIRYGTETDNISGKDWDPTYGDGASPGWWKLLRMAKYEDDGTTGTGWNSIFGVTDGTYKGDLESTSEVNIYQDEPRTTVSSGEWHYYEMYNLMGNTTESGHLTIWIDGVSIIDETLQTMNEDTYYYGGYNVVFSFWNGGAPEDQYAYVDNYYISTVERAYSYDDYVSGTSNNTKLSNITTNNVTFT